MNEDGEPVPSSSSACRTEHPGTKRKNSTQQHQNQVEANGIRGDESQSEKRRQETQDKCSFCNVTLGQGACHTPIEGIPCPNGESPEGNCTKCGEKFGIGFCSEKRCKDPYNAEATRPILTSSTEVAHYDWITAITDEDGQLKSEYAKPGGRIAIITGVDGRRTFHYIFFEVSGSLV